MLNKERFFPNLGKALFFFVKILKNHLTKWYGVARFGFGRVFLTIFTRMKPSVKISMRFLMRFLKPCEEKFVSVLAKQELSHPVEYMVYSTG